MRRVLFDTEVTSHMDWLVVVGHGEVNKRIARTEMSAARSLHCTSRCCLTYRLRGVEGGGTGGLAATRALFAGFRLPQL